MLISIFVVVDNNYNSLFYSGSHVVILLVERYPEYFVINLDKVGLLQTSFSKAQQKYVCHLHMLFKMFLSKNCSVSENLFKLVRHR